MGKKYAICLFSGTGNTEHVANLVAAQFRLAGIETDFFKVEKLVREKLTIPVTDYDKIGIAHPVLGFDCPNLIYRFIETLPAGGGKPVFLVKTAGDFHQINNGASKSVIRILGKKGYDVFFDDMFAMPCNWLMTLDDRMNRNLTEVAQKKAATVARQIMAGERKGLPIGFFFRWFIKGIAVLEEKYGARYFGQYLCTSSACTLCDKCVKNCPVANITNTGDKIRFGLKCIWCMRCVYNCPAKAIDNRYMNVFIVKGGYSLKRILGLAYDPIDFGAKKLGVWHGYYRRYFKEIP